MIHRRRALLALGGIGLAAGAAPARGDDRPPAADEEALLSLQRAWARAVARNDREALARIVGEGFFVTDPTGFVWDRDNFLAAVAAGISGVEALDLEDLHAHVYGDAAVVTGRSTYKTRPGRADLAGAYRFTNTYLRRDGRWVCVAGHEGRMA
jgi:ketosteroid isomerase-like protein